MEFPAHEVTEGKPACYWKINGKTLQVFGNHNLMNIQAAWLVCRELGVSRPNFSEADCSFYRCIKKT